MKKYIIALTMVATAFADFRYTSTIKSGTGAGTITKHLMKGNKMKLDMGSMVIISDFDAFTTTTITPAAKSYRVLPMSQTGASLDKAGVDFKVAIAETGQKKSIGGYNCRQVTMSVKLSGAMPMSMDYELWVSTDVPGASELKAISTKIAERSAAGGGGMQKAMLEVQRQSSQINGVPVLTIMHMKSGGDAMSKERQAKMDAARARMEEMKKKGGPAAAAMEKAMAGMGAAGSGNVMEMITESSDFSTANIPASEFAIPAGFTKAAQ